MEEMYLNSCTLLSSDVAAFPLRSGLSCLHGPLYSKMATWAEQLANMKNDILDDYDKKVGSSFWWMLACHACLPGAIGSRFRRVSRCRCCYAGLLGILVVITFCTEQSRYLYSFEGPQVLPSLALSDNGRWECCISSRCDASGADVLMVIGGNEVWLSGARSCRSRTVILLSHLLCRSIIILVSCSTVEGLIWHRLSIARWGKW